MTALYLALAILAEVVGTTALKASDGFSQWLPSIVTVAGYLLSLYFMGLTLRELPVGVTYAIWSGVGLVLITAAGWVLYDQALDLPAVLGMALIGAGVLVINLFSSSAQW